MRNRFFVAIAASLAIFAASGGSAAAQQAEKRDYQAEIRDAIQAAKSAAGFEFLGTLVRTCLLPVNRSDEATGDVPPPYMLDPKKIPPRSSWYAEPAKVFDNFYFLGSKVHSSWALTTRDGIILIDTLYPYNSEEEIIGGMRKLGLDPKDIKYILVSHAHNDHVGGAETFQKQYGARVVMAAADWDLLAKYPNRYRGMSPKRDIVATDGMEITLGGETVKIWLTPGHTPGTTSYTFSVLDRGKRVNVAYSGGTALVFESRRPADGIKNLQTYIESQRHLASKAKETGATVLLSNHSEFDNAYNKTRMLAGRGDGPSPFETGADWVQRYFKVTENCARAAQIDLERLVAGSQ
ncbi:MAG: MBL fold metallo-hydrolase [Rhodospirillaceae bacterium]